jgi:hypothetical protein
MSVVHMQVSGPIGVLGLALFRAFEAFVFVVTIAYGVSLLVIASILDQVFP